MGTLATSTHPTDAPRWIEGGPLDGQIGPSDRDAFTEAGARYRLRGSVFMLDGFEGFEPRGRPASAPFRPGPKDGPNDRRSDRPIRDQQHQPPRRGTR